MRLRKNLHSFTRVARASRVALIAIAVLAAGSSAAPGADESAELEQLDRAQRALGTLQARLGLTAEVTAELVPRHPLLVAVAPQAGRRGSYHLKLETGFVRGLTDDELDAVIAHELGHVWIYSHHPYLQTEQLANQVAMRVVSREALEAVYVKVAARGGKKARVARFSDRRP